MIKLIHWHGRHIKLSLQEFLVLIWSISEEWKDESTMKLPSGFEPMIPGISNPVRDCNWIGVLD